MLTFCKARTADGSVSPAKNTLAPLSKIFPLEEIIASQNIFLNFFKISPIMVMRLLFFV